MRVAVPEYIIFLSYFCDAAMVITNVILRFLTSGPAQVGVGHQHTPIGKWTFRGAAHTIAKLRLLQTGINMTVPVSIVTYAGCFKEWMRFIGGSFAGFNPVGAQKGLAGVSVCISSASRMPMPPGRGASPISGKCTAERNPYRGIRRIRHRARRDQTSVYPGVMCHRPASHDPEMKTALPGRSATATEITLEKSME